MTAFQEQSLVQADMFKRTEFISTMMRTKTKAQRDSYIATGLLPVAGAIDVLATLVWPFGGLVVRATGLWTSS
jgi:hypothetical protein